MLTNFTVRFHASTLHMDPPKKRTAPGPVVGWPPIRSFRKNLASGSSSKHTHGSHQQHHLHVEDKVDVKKHVDNSSGTKGLFVKINMDGVPIGRKVDINAYGSYEKLSSVVDELFRGPLAGNIICGLLVQLLCTLLVILITFVYSFVVDIISLSVEKCFFGNEN